MCLEKGNNIQPEFVSYNFSVIIPTFNNLELFKKALDSVLVQVGVSVEIIVTDDSKTNIIQDFCKKLTVRSDFNLMYFHNIPSLGAVKNWNYGISKANGDNIIILHHDERFPDDHYLKDLNSLLNSHDVVVTNIEVHDDQDVKKNRIPQWLKNFQLKNPYSIFWVNSIGPCACVAIKRRKIDFFDENLVWLVDCEWYYRMLSNNAKLKYLNNRFIVSQNKHDDKITNNLNVKKSNLNDLQILCSKYKSDIKVRIFLILNKFKSKVTLYLPVFGK